MIGNRAIRPITVIFKEKKLRKKRSQDISDKGISRVIYNYRMANNLTINELSDLLKVSSSTINVWETGKSNPNRENIEKLSKLFKVSERELINKIYRIES